MAANALVQARIDEDVKARATAVPSIISSETTIRGDLQSDGDVQIEGRIYGDLNVTKLTIAEGGMVSGNITAKNVRICGALNGSVRSEMVTLTATARVVGDIHHELLAIETGGQLEGMSRRLVPNPQAQVMQAEEYRAHEHSEG